MNRVKIFNSSSLNIDPGHHSRTNNRVDGEVVAVNHAALRTPSIVNEDPYGNGWLLKVKATRLASNTRNLLTGNVARTWVEESLNGIRLQSGESLGLVYQDGGAPVCGMAKALYGEEWAKAVHELFLTQEESV
jgi:hypothetical protein